MLVEPRSLYRCPFCGGCYDPATVPDGYLLVPLHDYAGAVCLGSEQHPRNALSDRRPLWRELASEVR